MIRFCDDCLQERTDTTWSDKFSARLCEDCFNLRCEALDAEADADAALTPDKSAAP